MRPAAREEEVICPNCRRYIGSLGRCPYCRAKSPKRRAYKLLKWGGLALAVIGVLALYVDALWFKVVVRDAPPLSLSEIEPTMNFAAVNITGTVTGVRYEDDTKWMSIWLDDNFDDYTDAIFIRVYDSETKQLIERNNVPGVGQEISIVGQLRLRPGFTQLILNVAGALDILPETPENLDIGDVVSNPENYIYERVRVQGKVIEIETTKWGAKDLTLLDVMTGDELTVYVQNYPWFAGYDGLGVSEGDTLEVTGGVELYFNEVQLHPANLSDIEVVS